MSTEQNKQIAIEFMDEVLNGGNLDAADKYFADNYVDHTLPPDVPPNVEGLKQLMTMFMNAFPDLHSHAEDVIAEGDKVVVRVPAHGTHKGELMGIPATGKEIHINEIHIVRMADRKMVEHWGVEDQMGMVQQLGLVEGPE